MNFKKNFGFAQGNGRKGVDVIREAIRKVDFANIDNMEHESFDTNENSHEFADIQIDYVAEPNVETVEVVEIKEIK